MTTETRHMRNAQESGYYQLLVPNTSSYGTLSVGGAGELAPEIAIRVKKEDGTILVNWQSELIDNTTYTLYTIYANIPSTLVERIIVDVRVSVNGAENIRSFRTDVLNAIVSGTWQFKVWARFSYSPQLEYTTAFFRHGNSTYNSRVENFTYNPPPPPSVGGILAQII